MKVSNVHSAKATFNAHRRMSQARVLAFWSISVSASMLAALASSVNVPMHAGDASIDATTEMIQNARTRA